MRSVGRDCYDRPIYEGSSLLLCNLNKELAENILIHCGKTSIPPEISWTSRWLVNELRCLKGETKISKQAMFQHLKGGKFTPAIVQTKA